MHTLYRFETHAILLVWWSFHAFSPDCSPLNFCKSCKHLEMQFWKHHLISRNGASSTHQSISSRITRVSNVHSLSTLIHNRKDIVLRWLFGRSLVAVHSRSSTICDSMIAASPGYSKLTRSQLPWYTTTTGKVHFTIKLRTSQCGVHTETECLPRTIRFLF